VVTLLYCTGKIAVTWSERSAKKNKMYFWDCVPDENTVARRLFDDISNIFPLEELRPHVMQHFNNNWIFHICNYSYDSERDKLARIQFSHHFLSGLLHWNGDHYHCINCHQEGLFPRTLLLQTDINVASALYDCMANMCKQMANPAVILTNPFMCHYDPAYEHEPLPTNELPEIIALLSGEQLDYSSRQLCICKHRH